MRKLLAVVVFFLSTTAWAYEYPPRFERWDDTKVVTAYRQFQYTPRGFDSILNTGKVDAVVTYKKDQQPEYAIINLPGGDGGIHLSLDENQKIKSFWGYNTMTRMRKLFAQNNFYVVTMDATDNANRILSIAEDLRHEFPGIRVYVTGISRSTRNTISLSRELDGKIDGFIHMSSMADTVHSLDTTQLQGRNVLIHDKNDTCQGTPYSAAEYSAKKYGTELITIVGGEDYDRWACGPFTAHGFYQTETKLFDAMYSWIKK